MRHLHFGTLAVTLASFVAAVTLIGVYALLRSRMGLALMAARDNEQGAASVGIPVARNRLIAFLVSAAICGLCGGVYYLSILYVDPAGAFDLDWQIRLLFIVIVGGVGTVEGPIVGTAIDGMPITKGFALKNFGYFVLDRAAGGWDGVLYAPDDSVLAHCALRGRDIDCH